MSKSPALAGGFFTTNVTWEAHYLITRPENFVRKTMIWLNSLRIQEKYKVLWEKNNYLIIKNNLLVFLKIKKILKAEA